MIFDADGTLDPASVTVISGPSNGGTSVNPVTGEVTYTPNLGFTGTDVFVYEVCDNDGDCDTATVTITVEPGNLPPIANDDAAVTDENVPVVVDVLANDLDLDGTLDPSTVVENRSSNKWGNKCESDFRRNDLYSRSWF